jgi:DNA-binding response OmpR family regulator/curved DNA-binding protein CbpA
VSSPNPVNILVVDDDRAIQRLLADALSKQGFAVTVERDGEWAVKTFEKKPFDAVLLDILLPGLNGYEVAKRMRALPRGQTLPIILISGVYKSPGQQKEAVEKHGATAFLEKPIRLPQLFDLLRTQLGEAYPDPRPPPPPPPSDDSEPGVERLADLAAREEKRDVETSSKSLSSFQSIRGSFDKKPFPEVLAEIYRWRATGALLLRRATVKKIVFFRDGMPLHIKSNLLSECLGRVMVRERMISEVECEESIKRMKASKRQQGTLLIEMGCISPHNLVYALTLQLQAKLYDIFTWQDGEYQFNPKVPTPAETTSLELSTAAAIYEGVRHAYDAERIRRALGNVDGMFVHPSPNPLLALQEAGLGEDEQQLLLAIDGHQTVATVRALAILPPLEVDRFLYAMSCAQMIELRHDPAKGKAKPHIARLAHAAPPPLKPPPLKASTGDKPPPRTQVVAQSAGSLLPELASIETPAASEDSLARERLAAKVAQMRKLDYFELLGVPRTATRDEVKRAYFAMAKEYHPDKHFGSSSAEVRELSSQIYDRLTTAHSTLVDDDERARYLKELDSGKKPDGGDEIGRILAAEGKFQRGEEMLRNRSYRAAYELFHQAVELYGEEGEFHAYLGWSLFQSDPKNPETADAALRALERAVTLNPRADKSYLFTGYIFKATGRPDKAEKQFEKAIQCNPDCTEALRELRILGKPRR